MLSLCSDSRAELAIRIKRASAVRYLRRRQWGTLHMPWSSTKPPTAATCRTWLITVFLMLDHGLVPPFSTGNFSNAMQLSLDLASLRLPGTTHFLWISSLASLWSQTGNMSGLRKIYMKIVTRSLSILEPGMDLFWTKKNAQHCIRNWMAIAKSQSWMALLVISLCLNRVSLRI